MRKQRWQKMSNLSVLIALGLLMIGCGPQNYENGQTVNASSATTTTVSSAGKLLSVCSRDSQPSSNLEILLSSYKELSGMINPSIMHVKLTTIPSEFSAQNLQLRFFKWRADAGGNPSVNGNSLEFRFEKKISTDSFEILPYQTSTYTSFNYDDLKALAAKLGLTSNTAAYFFDRYAIRVYLDDQNMSYQVLRTSLQKVVSGQSNTEFKFEDSLMPPFYAEPAYYTQVKPSVLSDLHPLKGSSANLAQMDYVNYTRAFCF